MYKSLLQKRLLFCLLSDVQGSFQQNLSHKNKNFFSTHWYELYIYKSLLHKGIILCLLSDIYVYIYKSLLQKRIIFGLLSDIYVYIYKSLLQKRLLFCLLSDVQGSFQKNLSSRKDVYVVYSLIYMYMYVYIWVCFAKKDLFFVYSWLRDMTCGQNLVRQTFGQQLIVWCTRGRYVSV